MLINRQRYLVHIFVLTLVAVLVSIELYRKAKELKNLVEQSEKFDQLEKKLNEKADVDQWNDFNVARDFYRYECKDVQRYGLQQLEPLTRYDGERTQ
jgi:hypothetical protein